MAKHSDGKWPQVLCAGGVVGTALSTVTTRIEASEIGPIHVYEWYLTYTRKLGFR